jgi:RNA polymerase sigma-70 factor (ECF subfamily)
MSPEQRYSFDDYVREIAPELLDYFARRVTPPDAAADCLGEVLLVLWRRRDSVPAEHGERRAWAFGVAHRVLKSHYRSAARRSALTESLRTELLAQSDPPPLDAVGEELADALASLRVDDRDLVLLVAWEGFSLVDAAKVLGIRADAARARYSRARKRLQQALVTVRD